MAAKLLRYPLNRLEANSDYLSINIVEYTPPGIESGSNDLIIRNIKQSNCAKKKPLGTILLPMPDGLVDGNSVDWQAAEANSIALSAAGNIKQGLQETNLRADTLFNKPGEFVDEAIKSGKSTVSNALNKLRDPQVKDALSAYFTSQAVNVFGANVSADTLLSREQGIVLNPNKQFLFRGVNLRDFTFSFTLNPRNQQESEQIKAIINTFKRRMAAKSSSSGNARGLFIKSPDVFELEFKRGGRKHPFLFTMKTCALKSIQVDYTRTGNYITYEDSTPVQMSMTLNFGELSAIYSEDYSDNLSEGVGF